MDERLDEHDARADHVSNLVPAVCPRSKFDRALLTLLQLQPRDGRDGIADGRRRAMIAALDYRATWIQIRHWRRGTGRVPQWAKNLVAAKIANRRRRDEQAESDAINA